MNENNRRWGEICDQNQKMMFQVACKDKPIKIDGVFIIFMIKVKILTSKLSTIMILITNCNFDRFKQNIFTVC